MRLVFFFMIIAAGTSIFFAMADMKTRAVLNQDQQIRLNSIINYQVHSSDEKKVVRKWPESKRIAEFICRPIAFNTIKKGYPDVERIFLGEGEEGATLSLESANRLKGHGFFRTGMDWHHFKFECLISDKGDASEFHFQVVK